MGRYVETIVGVGAPHSRPCAVDYHTALRMRSRQRQHDSPHPPHTHASTLSPPAPLSRVRVRNLLTHCHPHTSGDYTKRKERKVLSYSSLLFLAHFSALYFVLATPIKDKRTSSTMICIY